MKAFFKNNFKNIIAFTFSLLLHSSFFILIYSLKNAGGLSAKQESQGIGDSDLQEVNVIEKPEEKFEEEVLELEKDEEGQEPLVKDFLERECKETYGGIGIEQSYMDGTVLEVFKGYPAWLAGLEVGDRIKTLTGEDVRGPAGTSFQVTLIKKGSTESTIITLTRGDICYEAGP